MRTMCWRPILLFSLLLVPGAQAAWAQEAPGGQYFYQQGGPPAMYGDPNGLPGTAGLGQAGYPPDAQFWPGTGMYDPGIKQHYMNNGFWFNRIINGKSRYFFTMEGMITRTGAPPHTLVGANRVNDVTAETANILGDGSQHNQRFVEELLDSTDGEPDRDFQGGNNIDVPIFLERDVGSLKQTFGSGGLRASAGWWNADGSGFMAQGYWQDVARSSFFLGDRSLDILVFGADGNVNVNFNALDHIQPWFGLPLPGADRDEDGLNGVVVPYDLFVDFQFRSNTFGGNLDWYFSPIYDRDYFKIRPVAGARYLTVNESFQFRAADSGLGYLLEPNDDLDSGGGTGGGTSQQLNFLLQTSQLDGGFTLPNPIESYLLSRTENQFAGPEAGLRFDIGSEKAKIWLQSKFGLLAYYNNREVSGYNIGDHFNVLLTDADVDGDDIPDNPLRAAGRNGSTFRDAKHNVSMAPMFEQGVFLEAPVLKYVPLINKMSVFENAQFQAGYTVLLLGNVYRASNDIDWQQFPNFPKVDNGRGLFYTTNWSLGVHWTY